MPKKINGKWDFGDLKGIGQISKEEAKKILEEGEEYQRKLKERLKKEEEQYGKRKRVR